MKIKIVAILIIFSIFNVLTVAPVWPPNSNRVLAATAGPGQSFVKNRVVALVFDDSGSMRYTRDPSTDQLVPIDNWKYANYSVQSLAGLLAPEDKLYVTRMSHPDTVEEIALEPDKRQSSIQSVQKWTVDMYTPTPFSSVKTAMNHLTEMAKENPDSEFWLVVLTDGVFNDFDPNDKRATDPVGSMKQARQQFQTYLDTMKSYNATVRSAFVTIEQHLNNDQKATMSTIKDLWRDSLDAKVIESNGQQNIISKINEVAALITNRDPTVGADNASLHPIFTDGNVQFNSLFPIRRLTMLEQVVQNSPGVTIPKSNNKLTINQGGSAEMEGQFQIATPVDPDGLQPPILGQITHYHDLTDEGAMQEGEYRIALKGAMDRKNRFQFLVEPALDFQLTVHKRKEDGTLSEKENEFFFGSQMLAQVSLVKNNGANEPLSLLPDSRKLIAVTGLLNDHSTLNFQWDDKLKAYTAPFNLPSQALSKVKVLVHIRGFYQNEQTIDFRGYTPRKFGMESGQVEWTARVDKLSEAEPLRFLATVDGESVSSEELKEIMPSLKVDTGGKRIHFDVHQEGSEIRLQPRPHWNYWFTDVGTIPITLTMNGKYPNEKASIHYEALIQDVSWWYRWGIPILALVGLILAGWWTLGMLKKPRFHRNSSYMSVTNRTLINGRARGEYESSIPFQTGWFSRWLIPYKAEMSIIQDCTFKAGEKRDYIILPKGSQFPGMKVVEEVLMDEDVGRRDYRIYNNDEVVVRNGQNETVYRYFK